MARGLAGEPDPRDEFREQRAIADDMAAQELGPANDVPRLPLTSTSYIRATHPDLDEAVVFVPGEALPEWVREALPNGKPDPAEPRVTVLEPRRSK